MSRGRLVGRQRELEELCDAAADGSIHGVVLGRPAGVGKTRRAAEFADALERDGGATVVRLYATPALGRVALGLLSAHLSETDQSGPQDLSALSAAVSQHLRRLAGERRLVIFIDDAQHLDPLSASLLTQLVASGEVFSAVTVRTGESVTEEVSRLWMAHPREHVELGPLDHGSAGRLAESVAGAPLEPDAADEVWRLAQGNPLFIVELVRGALRAPPRRDTAADLRAHHHQGTRIRGDPALGPRRPRGSGVPVQPSAARRGRFRCRGTDPCVPGPRPHTRCRGGARNASGQVE